MKSSQIPQTLEAVLSFNPKHQTHAQDSTEFIVLTMQPRCPMVLALVTFRRLVMARKD